MTAMFNFFRASGGIITMCGIPRPEKRSGGAWRKDFSGRAWTPGGWMRRSRTCGACRAHITCIRPVWGLQPGGSTLIRWLIRKASMNTSGRRMKRNGSSSCPGPDLPGFRNTPQPSGQVIPGIPGRLSGDRSRTGCSIPCPDCHTGRRISAASWEISVNHRIIGSSM